MAALIGSIVIWSKNQALIPSGWQICDGTNGTPDLRDKFVYGAKIDGDVGSTSGSATHDHINSDTGSAGSHTHSLSVTVGSSGSNKNASTYAGTQVSAPHSHTLSTTSDSDSNHTHTVPNTNSVSSIPPYIKLFFIMKVV